jgi:chemotaxis protein CheZ
MEEIMQTTKELVSKIQDELQGLTTTVSDVVLTFKKLQDPIEESRARVPQATMQLEKITAQTEQAANQMIDMVECITNISDQIVQEIGQLRRALPATYFKNRSIVRDTVNSIETKAQQNLDDAYVILNALQFQDITSQQVQHASSLMEEIENRLRNLMGIFKGDIDPEMLESAVKTRVYDPKANFEDSRDTQEAVDSLVKSMKSDD